MQVSQKRNSDEELSYEKKDLGNSKLELLITIPYSEFEETRQKSAEDLSKTIKVPGFRPGKAPKKSTEAYLGAQPYEEALNRLLPKYTIRVLQKEEITPLDQIKYKVEKVEEEAGVRFTASFTVYPTIKLGDFKKIKVKKDEVKVDEDEIDGVIENMYKESQKKNRKGNDKDEKTETTKSGIVVPKGAVEEDQVGSEADDVWAASFGIGVKTLKELKENVEKELKRQKEQMAMDKYVSDILAEIAKTVSVVVPETFISEEVAKREEDYRKRIENIGMKVEEFLEKQEVSLEELKKRWREEASVRIRNELILFQIVKDYSIKVSEEEVKKEVAAVRDPELKKQFETEEGRKYIQSVMLQQKAVRKLLDLVEN